MAKKLDPNMRRYEMSALRVAINPFLGIKGQSIIEYETGKEDYE